MTEQLTREALPGLLGRLDRILRRAVEQMLATYGPAAAADPFRGLYVSHDDAARLLDTWPGTQPYDGDGGEDHEPAGGHGQGIGPVLFERPRELASLIDDFGLSSFEVDVMLLALAPELDLRYERVFAFLQDDVSRRSPSVDLALNLLCATGELKLQHRRHFTQEAPLIRHHLIHLVPEPNSAAPPLLAHTLRLDERIVRRLLGDTCVDPLLNGVCTLVEPGDPETYWPTCPSLPNGQHDALVSQVRRIRSAGEPLQLYVSGRSGATRYFADGLAAAAGADVIAHELGLDLYKIDLSGVVSKYIGQTEKNLRCIFSAAENANAILFFDEADALFGKRSEVRDSHDRYANIEVAYLLQQMDQYEGVAILATNLRQNMDEAPGAPQGGSRGIRDLTEEEFTCP